MVPWTNRHQAGVVCKLAIRQELQAGKHWRSCVRAQLLMCGTMHAAVVSFQVFGLLQASLQLHHFLHNSNPGCLVLPCAGIAQALVLLAAARSHILHHDMCMHAGRIPRLLISHAAKQVVLLAVIY
jgi:hypothetical protein